MPETEAGALDPQSCFEGASEIWLEIGFGGGEHTIGQASANPEVGLIGCEVFYEGLAKCLRQIEDRGLTNIRLWDEDARELMAMLQTGSIDRCFILFPDPWPKTKHQKRRLIQPSFLDELARLMKPNGHVRFATDVRSYADEALVRFLDHTGFEWRAEGVEDWRSQPVGHIQTRYQTKQLGDIAPVYFDFSVHP